MNTLPTDVRYSHLTWNCPLSESAADSLLQKLDLGPETTIVDIGCGWGELLLRATKLYAAVATGLDTDPDLLARCNANAAKQGVKIRLLSMSGERWTDPSDRALCIGSSHVFGGTRAMLERLARTVPHGRVLIGDMCWERPPSQACADMFGDGVLPLEEIVKVCRETGWRLLHLETATQRDWDAFECGHRAGPREWLLRNGEDERAVGVEQELEKREDGYFGVYRGRLGFVFAVLAR